MSVGLLKWKERIEDVKATLVECYAAQSVIEANITQREIETGVRPKVLTGLKPLKGQIRHWERELNKAYAILEKRANAVITWHKEFDINTERLEKAKYEENSLRDTMNSQKEFLDSGLISPDKLKAEFIRDYPKNMTLVLAEIRKAQENLRRLEKTKPRDGLLEAKTTLIELETGEFVTKKQVQVVNRIGNKEKEYDSKDIQIIAKQANSLRSLGSYDLNKIATTIPDLRAFEHERIGSEDINKAKTGDELAKEKIVELDLDFDDSIFKDTNRPESILDVEERKTKGV